MSLNRDALFQTTEALRKRVEALETSNAALHVALLRANEEIALLAKRVKYSENFLKPRHWGEPFTPPE
jgi:hypothetical protein